MSRAFEDRDRAPRDAARNQDRPVPAPVTPPAASFAQLASRLQVSVPPHPLGGGRSRMPGIEGRQAPVQRRAADGPVDFSGIAGPGRPRSQVSALPEQLRLGVEARSGLPMDDVRVHRNSARPARLGALAYAQGRDIHLGPGQERHLPHEAWHVVQQAQGRVRPTRSLQAGVAVNDEAGLEYEADTMGARAFQPVTAPPSTAGLLRLAPHRPTRPFSSIVQREEYPKDTTGTIDKDFEIGKTKVNGAKLQADILDAAEKTFKTMPEGTPGGLRLGSYALSAEGTFTLKADAEMGGKNEEEHGMPYLSQEQRSQLPQEQICQLIYVTLHDAGQWQYLINPANRSIFDTHEVIIDVDCQFNRTGQVGFHKDSRGTTAFVNLTFRNAQEMTGTEYYEDLEGDPGQEQGLPLEVKKDIALRRDAARGKKSEENNEIYGGKLQSYGRISFSDPNLYHSSPLMGNRYRPAASDDPESWASVPRSEMLDLILDRDKRYPRSVWEAKATDEQIQADYISHKIRDAAAAASKSQMLDLILRQDKRYTREKWESDASDEDIRENYLKHATNTYNTSKRYHGHGLEKNSSLNGQQTKMALSAAKRSRRMSTDLSGADRRQEVEAEITQLRTFIRTWVRFVKK